MPPIDKAKVKIKITKRFTDDGGRLFGPGIWEVHPSISMRLVANGRATLVDGPAPAKAAKEPAKPPATNPRIPQVKEEGEAGPTPLPEGFPCQGTLAVAGFTSVESLQVEGIKEKLEAVEGLTPADVTKIGIAISKV